MDPRLAKQGGDYRKGNWTMEETMVLIEAKRMDHKRRMKRVPADGAKPAELRWKWVEDYCRKRGCFRSQNQCNDKWDNLMRDFKKVREYELRAAAGGGGDDQSYWRIEKSERKERSLPSNMLPQIYEALMASVERKAQRLVGGGSSGGLGQLPPVFQDAPAAVPLFPPQQTPAEVPNPSFSLPLPTAVDSETCQEHSESAAKRRKRREEGEGTSSRARGTSSRLEEVVTAISRSVSMVAEAIKSSEERGERRHREMVRLHERRLQIEESNRQGIDTLADAINKLTNSILHLPPSNIISSTK